MLQRTTFLSIAGLALATFLWGYFFAFAKPKDVDAYYLLETKKAELSQTKNLATTQQSRHGVLKDIYLVEDHQRLHYRVRSVSSILTLVPRTGRFDLYEKLENIDCWLQDKLYYDPKGQHPMQQMKHLKAKEGTYDYTSSQFLAGSVDLSLYRVPGHLLVPPSAPPFMHGIAEEVSFAVSGKNPEFHAHHFKALLGGQGESK